MSDTRVRVHPTLGILVCTDGHVMVPANGKHPAHWTFGCVNGRGYLRVKISGKDYLSHRLVAETFLPNPNNYPTVDHINRDKKSNMVHNLRWADRNMQQDNRQVCEASLKKYGVRRCEDVNAYKRALYANNPEYAERVRARHRQYMRNRRARKKVGKDTQLDLF